jgi:hypothetical protein
MNPFLLDPKDRLGNWKELRAALSGLPEDEQLKTVAEYWAKAPLDKFAYDIDQPDTIPSPWEMVSDGNWCRNSVAIGMEFTLRLAGWSPSRLRLAMMRDWDISEQIIVLIIDDSRVLNYSYGSVVEYPKTRHDIVGAWRFTGKFYSPEGA